MRRARRIRFSSSAEASVLACQNHRISFAVTGSNGELVPKGGFVVVCKVLRSAFAVGLLDRDEELDRPCGQCAQEFRMPAQEHSEVVRERAHQEVQERVISTIR